MSPEHSWPLRLTAVQTSPPTNTQIRDVTVRTQCRLIMKIVQLQWECPERERARVNCMSFVCYSKEIPDLMTDHFIASHLIFGILFHFKYKLPPFHLDRRECPCAVVLWCRHVVMIISCGAVDGVLFMSLSVPECFYLDTCRKPFVFQSVFNLVSCRHIIGSKQDNTWKIECVMSMNVKFLYSVLFALHFLLIIP